MGASFKQRGNGGMKEAIRYILVILKYEFWDRIEELRTGVRKDELDTTEITR